jgi:small-conductance mechanosensitive channel
MIRSLKLFCKLSAVPLMAFFLIAAMAGTSASFAQAKKKHPPRSQRDSLRRTFLKRDSLLRSYKQTDGSINSLLQKIEYYSSLYNQDKSDLSRGFDTTDVSKQLPVVERRMAFMNKLVDNDQSSSLSYLFTIRDILDHIDDQLNDWQDKLSRNNTKIEKIHDDVEIFQKDTVLQLAPADSLLRITYLKETGEVQKKWSALNGTIHKSLIRIGSLQNRVTALDILMLDIKDKIDLKISEFGARSLTNEYGFIWNMHSEGLSRYDSTQAKTIALNSKLLKYFFDPKTTSHTNLVSHTVTLLLFVLFLVWMISSRRKMVRVKPDHLDTFAQIRYIINSPVICSLLISAILGLYVYDQPPFIFLEILMLVMMICIGVLIKKVWSAKFFRLWCGMLLLFVLYGISNLFIQVSYADRIFILLFSIAGMVMGILFLKGSKKVSDTDYPPYACLVMRIFVICQAVSLVLNLLGRLSLSKLVAVASTFNLCLAFGFYLFIQILMECLFLQLEANKTVNTSIVSYIDFNEVQKKFKSVLVRIAGLLWLVKLAENLDVDDFIFGRIGDFLNHPYKFSTTAFTFGSIAIFLFVLWISVIISRIITYFYDFSQQQSELQTDFKRTKTSILLIRLSVYVVGFFAAVMFSGIPMDRITLILGALGVGIGFGLQNIVNNLVSGVILAFEKPVQVGDIIEVGNRSGQIKEIGIRASKIEAGDGSELIVPNGDLISQHVINWTLSNSNRRVELIVGVAYGSDITKVEALLKSMIRSREDVMQMPAPLVFLHNFSDSSVDFRLLFWVADINTSLGIKSKIMSEIYTEFAKEGIEIPHPKRDIQVFFPDGTSAEIKAPDPVNKNLPDPGH